MDHKNYAAALAFLRSRNRKRVTQYQSNNLKRVELPSGNLAGRGSPAILGMREWLQKLGHEDADIDRLNIIHVAGTKGKGSTCAYIESFLRTHRKAARFPCKTGLYTSPHLMKLNERIRIDFEALSDAQFAKYIFEVRDALHLDFGSEGPGYLQLLALVSFHTFLREGVDVAIYETHHGGEYCATNVIPNPVVTAVTPIGLDHVQDLGKDLDDIAWHKAGIFKKGTAFTTPQEPIVMSTLKARAAEKGVALQTVIPDYHLPGQFPSEAQRLNCSLARAVANEFLRKVAPDDGMQQLSPSEIEEGIRQFRWRGRFERISVDDYTWYLDVAHNELSAEYAAKWFQEDSVESAESITRILILARINSSKRDADGVVRTLAKTLHSMQTVIFTPKPSDEDDSGDSKDREFFEHYSEIWRSSGTHQNSDIHFAPTVDQAIDIAKEKRIPGDKTHVFVTGSSLLVGKTLVTLGLEAY